MPVSLSPASVFRLGSRTVQSHFQKSVLVRLFRRDETPRTLWGPDGAGERATQTPARATPWGLGPDAPVADALAPYSAHLESPGPLLARPPE